MLQLDCAFLRWLYPSRYAKALFRFILYSQNYVYREFRRLCPPSAKTLLERLMTYGGLSKENIIKAARISPTTMNRWLTHENPRLIQKNFSKLLQLYCLHVLIGEKMPMAHM